jgi:tetratricopeptide (TPR) repeat protein
VAALRRQEQRLADLQIGGCTAVIRSGRETSRNLAIAFHNCGGAYDNKGQYDRAIHDYDQAIRLDPSNANAFNNRGNTYDSKGQCDRAIDYGQAIRLDPTADVFNNRCWARAVSGRDLQPAMADCNESLRLKPDVGITLNSRALVWFKLGNFTRAIADYSAAIAQNAKDVHSLFSRGVARQKSGDISGGQTDIAAAVAIESDIENISAKYGLKR